VQEPAPTQQINFCSTQKQISKQMTEYSKLIVKNPVAGLAALNLQGSGKKEFNNTMYKNLNQN
jgi:hypothetical protein